MTERMYGGYPESCIREGLFQLEGEQVIAITRDLLAERDALREALTRIAEYDDPMDRGDACAIIAKRALAANPQSSQGDGYYAVALHPDGTSTDLKKPYCRDCGSNDVSMEGGLPK